MGMKQKLEKAYREGFNDGQGYANESLMKLAEQHGFLKGSHETWRAVEGMINNIPGIGPKTTEKIMRALREKMNDERC